jgi:hypothetical protein
MMSHHDTAGEPQTFADLPIQPTGSGVADLEIAYEQMRLEQDEDEVAVSTPEEVAELTPLESGTDATESAAHPS